MNELWKQFLNDYEVSELEKLNDNPILFEALTKIFTHEIVRQGTFQKDQPFDINRNFVLEYVKTLGADLSAAEYTLEVKGFTRGIELLQRALNEIKKFRKPEKVVEEKNEAR